MSLRLIAKDLYRLQQEVDRLEKALAASTEERRRDIQQRLARARDERNQLRRMLDGRLDR